MAATVGDVLSSEGNDYACEVKLGFLDWLDFVCYDLQCGLGTHYNQTHRSANDEHALFLAELREGHPEAVAMLTRYTTWKLRK